MSLTSRPASTLDTAITLLQHLATLAADHGEACARPLFQAADYLQDVLDCMPELSDAGAADEVGVEFEVLMASLSQLLPDPSQPLHS
jgi:hypothetical protein